MKWAMMMLVTNRDVIWRVPFDKKQQKINK